MIIEYWEFVYLGCPGTQGDPKRLLIVFSLWETQNWQKLQLFEKPRQQGVDTQAPPQERVLEKFILDLGGKKKH